MSNITFEEAVSQIKDKLDILEIISKDVILKKTGNNYWGLCPFHKEKTPSFSVNPSKGIFKCFGCGEGGDALTYLMKTRGLEFSELIKELAQEYGVELPNTYSKSPDKSIKDSMLKACEEASEFYTHNLFSSSASKVALDYLTNRGIDENIIKTYSLGLAPKEPSKLYKKLKENYSDDVLEKAGLILKASSGEYVDRFRNRIIIPIHDENGNVVAFGARALEEGQKPKYLNSSDSLIYNKSKLLYGLYFAKDSVKELDSVIIMEGYFDVISSQAHGIKNCVASCGTSLTSDHIKLMSRYTKSRKIFLSFDTDAAGLKAANRGGALIKEAFEGLGDIKQFDESFTETSNDKYACEIRVITPPEGKDPDEFVRSVGADEYLKYLEKAPLLLDFQINQVLKNNKDATSPVEKVKVVKELIPILKEINNKIVRSEYIKVVSSTLKIDEKALTSEISKSINSTAFSPKIEENNVKRIVTKSSNIIEKAQKNLLSLYLVNVKPLNFQEINEKLENINFTDENLIIVKNTIDKLIFSVNNVKVLTEALYVKFASDEEKKAIVTDLVCISEAFNNLNKKDFIATIDELSKRIDDFHLAEENKKLRIQYKNVNDNDTEALKFQLQLREKLEKLKKTTGD